jgi:hypothetical protein
MQLVAKTITMLVVRNPPPDKVLEIVNCARVNIAIYDIEVTKM